MITVLRFPQKFLQKKATPIAEEGNKKLDQCLRSAKLLNKLINQFAKFRSDLPTMQDAMKQIEAIVISEIKNQYTARIDTILKPLENLQVEQMKKENANESTINPISNPKS